MRFTAALKLLAQLLKAALQPSVEIAIGLAAAPGRRRQCNGVAEVASVQHRGTATGALHPGQLVGCGVCWRGLMVAQ